MTTTSTPLPEPYSTILLVVTVALAVTVALIFIAGLAILVLEEIGWKKKRGYFCPCDQCNPKTKP